MADSLAGQTREGLALLFFNAIVAQEHPDGTYTRAYALDLLTEVVMAIDGKRDLPARTHDAEPVVVPIPELEAELAAEAPVARGRAAAAPGRTRRMAPPVEAVPEPKRRGRPPKAAPEPVQPARRGRLRNG